MLHTLIDRIIHAFLTVLVVIYIVLEELVWETIAKPVYRFIHSLEMLQRLETVIERMDRLALLLIFLLLFVQVEVLGLLALGLMAKGKLIAGTTLYAGKIPVAAFTFWLFRISNAKLMTFLWFKASYLFVTEMVEKLKATEIHRTIVAKVVDLKGRLKARLPSRSRIKEIYRVTKRYVKEKLRSTALPPS